MPSRDKYPGEESFADGDETYTDLEEDVGPVRERDRDFMEESGMPYYPHTEGGDELRYLYRLYGFDTTTRYDHNPDDYRRTAEMVNEVHLPSQMGDNVYISNFETAQAYLQGEELHTVFPRIKYVMSIIDFRENDTSQTWRGIVPMDTREYPADSLFRLNVKDDENTNLVGWFPKICEWIHDKVESREHPTDGILIHCRKGMSRSVTALMAYLMWRDWKDHKQALRYVRDIHHVAFPNKGFMDQLRLWGECHCDFSYGEGRDKFHEYLYGWERELVVADSDQLPRPDVMTDLRGVTRPADPLRRSEPQPAPVRRRYRIWQGTPSSC